MLRCSVCCLFLLGCLCMNCLFFFCFSLYFVYPLLVVTLSLSSVVFFYCCCFSLFANNAVPLIVCFVLLFLYYYNNDFPPLPRGGSAGEPNSVFAHIPSPACSAVALPAQLHCLLLPSSRLPFAAALTQNCKCHLFVFLLLVIGHSCQWGRCK